MTRRLAFLSARLIAAVIFILTWGYGVTAGSTFAFDMFVKPQLSKPLTDFVVWHTAWWLVAYGLSAATLVPIVRTAAGHDRRRRAARAAAIGYLAAMGGVTLWLIGRPYLALLAGGSRDLLVVPGALVPLVWLSVIDHLSALRSDGGGAPPRHVQRALFRTAIATPILLWLAHLVHARLDTAAAASAPTMAGAAWALLLALCAFQLGYAALSIAAGLSTGRRGHLEYGATVAVAAIGVTEYVRRIVLPPLAFPPADAWLVAAPFGIAMALMVSGLRVATGAEPARDGLYAFAASRGIRPMVAVAAGVIAVTLAAATTTQVERLDWAFILQQTVALAEAVIVASLVLSLAAPRGPAAERWSWPMLVVPPLAAVAVMHGASRAASDPQSAVDRAIASDPFVRAAAAALVSRQPFDVAFYRGMLESESSNWALSPAAPAAEEAIAPRAPLPHVFLIVMDSLRRDYLSPYNPAVTFTPSIDRWARDAFVFRNAFTPYGGTALAMPALWAGRQVPRGWQHIITSINRLESLIATAGYDFLINDYTIETHLRPETKRTFLNRFVASPNTDLCQNLATVQQHLRGKTAAPPAFVFLAPMNVHILNTRVGSDRIAQPGFHPPYASQLENVDTCFGGLIDFLKAEGLYDNSVIILTSDHGDSLGEGDRWGHQSFLFPEIVRIPLLISLPAETRTRLATDVGRLALLSDITPSLIAILTGRFTAAEPPDGSTLFTPIGTDLPERQRRAFLLMSSYGSTYGLLRRNGRQMYMADISNWQDYAFRLGAVNYEQVPLTDVHRRVNQADLTAQAGLVESLYRRPLKQTLK